ncbi:hypothetical protein D3C77_608470 [compost metagenome]
MQAAQGTVHQLLQAPAVLGFQLLLHVHELIEVFIVMNVLAQVMVARKQLAHAGQPLGDHVEHRAIVRARQLLRQLTDLQRRGAPDLTVIGGLLALDQAQHAGFAGAIAADDAHPLAPGDLPGHLFEQGRGAIGQGYIGELEQRHGVPPETGRAF